ncbi:MAG: putative transport system permease protein [Acidimicrobiaceae bacterium]|jgi:putative ABC transport system permease protein
MLSLTWVRGAIGRRAGRSVAEAIGIAIAVALVVAIGSFLGVAKRTMTARSVEHVAVDWQVEAQPGADPQAAVDTVRSQPGVASALPVDFASTAGMSATTATTTQTTGAGVVIGIPSDYAQQFPGELRLLTGSAGGALLAQQTASNLHATPGTVVVISRTGFPDVPITIAGVVEVPQADSLFQKVGAPPQSQSQAPPDNVVLLPSAQWHTLFDPVAAARPDLVHHQVHVRLDRHIPTDPAAAFDAVTGAARNLEVRSAGTVVVGNNIGAALDGARQDALYAQVLFVFLGLPGAALAVLIASTIAASGNDRRRAEHALLRARGATPVTVTWLATIEAACIGAIASIAGVLIGSIAANAFSLAWSAIALSGGILIAVATIAGPLWRDARRITVAEGRSQPDRVWRHRIRVPLAMALLAASAVVFNRTSSQGYNLVLAPEGVSAISVSYWAFLGPALLWLGAALLISELALVALRRARRLTSRLLRPMAGELAPTVAASMRRQRRLLARGVVLVALTIAFAVSTAGFNETYQQQAHVDALLTNGADVTVTSVSRSGLSADLVARVHTSDGVGSVEPLAHRYAYVGTDLQDLYGVRPDTIGAATGLQDAYFSGGTAHDLLARLAATPDGVLVSAETVKDFQLQTGDQLILRLESRTGGEPVPVTFHYIGVAKEFPTAPRDSFLVANAEYVSRSTGNTAVDTLLVSTTGSPRSVADGIRSITGTDATVSDLTTTRQIVGSSLTAVDLGGLTRIELGFALVLVMVATGLVLALGVAERRRTFAIASALGARTRHIASFVWSESAYVTLAGLLLGVILAWTLTHMLIAVLTGVFDPAPERAAVPWPYLWTLLAVAISAVVVASAIAIRLARRAPLSALRDNAW